MALDGLLEAFKKEKYSLDQVPVVLMDEINKAIPGLLKQNQTELRIKTRRT